MNKGNFIKDKKMVLILGTTILCSLFTANIAYSKSLNNISLMSDSANSGANQAGSTASATSSNAATSSNGEQAPKKELNKTRAEEILREFDSFDEEKKVRFNSLINTFKNKINDPNIKQEELDNLCQTIEANVLIHLRSKLGELRKPALAELENLQYLSSDKKDEYRTKINISTKVADIQRHLNEAKAEDARIKAEKENQQSGQDQSQPDNQQNGGQDQGAQQNNPENGNNSGNNNNGGNNNNNSNNANQSNQNGTNRPNANNSGSSSGGQSSSSFRGSSSILHVNSKNTKAVDILNNGAWNIKNGKWSYNSNMDLKSKWAKIENPYSNSKNKASWFKFDKDGNMLTGWLKDDDGKWYYLNDKSDGSLGAMLTSWQWIKGKDGKQRCYFFSPISNGSMGQLLTNVTTPDGYAVNENGEWTVSGVVQTK